MRKLIHTIERKDILNMPVPTKHCPSCGHALANRQVLRERIRGAIGRIILRDVGKRVYDVDGVIQVENEIQRDERIAREAT